jgi:hypothetical protein
MSLLRSVCLLFVVLQAGAVDIVGSTGCTAPACVFANNNLRFGNGGETSVNAQGLFVQPFYFSQSANNWYKLTFSNYPLDTAIGTGTGGPNWSGTTVADLYSATISGSDTDYSGFVVSSADASKSVGYGVIIATRNITINGQLVTFQNRFSLGQTDNFVQITTRMTNIHTSPIQNALMWVGTRDDFVGNADVNVKTRGNIINGQFQAVTANDQTSYAIMITNTNEGVLFYSETLGVMTSYAFCCSFSNAYNTNPTSIPPSTPSGTDGSYAAVLPIGTLDVGQSSAIVWYYAAGSTASLSNVVQDVSEAQQAEAAPVESPSVSTQPSLTPSTQPSLTPSVSATASISVTSSVSTHPSLTPSISSTSSVSTHPSISATASISMTSSVTPSVSTHPSFTSSISITPSVSTHPSSSASISVFPTASVTVSPTPSPSDIFILQLNFAECAVERNSLISQKQMCMIEKEVCLNQTETITSNAYLEKQEAVLQVNNLEYYQRVILGVLIAIAGLSLCINFCFCVRELRSFLIRRKKTLASSVLKQVRTEDVALQNVSVSENVVS